MKFAIITQVEHGLQDNRYFAYSPYVKEMNIWSKYVDELLIVAPLSDKPISAIHSPYQHHKITFKEVEAFSLTSAKDIIKTLLVAPKIIWQIYKVMRQADHIHLRCPGNMGLLGCLVQIAFPKTPKTAKYAGNWDSNSPQPWSYKLQKWILKNPFLTKKMQVLVYGKWKGSTKNIKPFFTASYREADKKEVKTRNTAETIKLLFVGTLSKGKRPLYAVQLVEQLYLAGYKVRLDLYGEGIERSLLEKYISEKKLASLIALQGNQTSATVQNAYENSHFLILPSQSEGWPKVVAEAMFWGCVPLVSAVSCVPDMLDNGERGIILAMDLQMDTDQIKSTLDNPGLYEVKATKATEWSRHYTLDYFEEEIRKLIQK